MPGDHRLATMRNAVHPGVVRRLLELVHDGHEVNIIRGTSLGFLDLKA